jgi:hypothetical protein
MLTLPKSIAVQLVDGAGVRLEEPDVMVHIHIFVAGQYYFGSILGLTDERGLASIRSAELEEHFEEDRQLFPMDYKVPLRECDSAIEIIVRGAKEAAMLRDANGASPFMSSNSKELLERARNREFLSTSLHVDVKTRIGDRMIVALPASRIESLR